ncbi:glycosyltransferase [Sagittula stellata]|uniref:glycosyltransferase n=1 Tax=Sagittula stellata TaxID=52603 RepID=UPI00321A5188
MIALLTLGLYPSSGGPAKSIRAFRDALGAEVVSWVDPAELVAQDLIWDRTTVVTGSAAPVLKQLQIPVNGSTTAAERLIAQSRLVSVHSFWRWHNAWIHKVCRRHGVPYWYVPHGSLDPYVFESGATTKRLFMRGVGRTFLRDAATVVYSTEREREKARDIVGHDRAEVIHWPLADSDFRKRDSSVRAATRARLGIPEQAVTFLYFGRLSPMKRPLDTIRAFSAAETGGAHLIIVGNDFGITAADCRRVAAEAGVANRVHVIGAVYGAEKYGYLDAADVYMSLSSRENFNYTAAEALASGLVLILSPGNDLAPDLACLSGVIRLADDSPETTLDALQAVAGQGVQALAAQGAAGAVWAREHLSKARFDAAVAAAADRHAGLRPPYGARSADLQEQS